MHQKILGSLAKKLSLMLTLLLLIGLSISHASMQQDRKSPQATDKLMAELFKMQGKLISQGRNTQPAGLLKLISSRSARYHQLFGLMMFLWAQVWRMSD